MNCTAASALPSDVRNALLLGITDGYRDHRTHMEYIREHEMDKRSDSDQHMSIRIVPLTEEHWPEVSAIYNEGIATGHATFESEVPDWEYFDVGRLSDHRQVAVDGENVLGWVTASAVSDRCAYAGVVEDSVYVAERARGQGIGLKLLNALINSTEAAGIWTIQSGIFPENRTSIRLHERAGFRVVGIRQRLGRMTYGPLAGVWRDVVMIERRSQTAGLINNGVAPNCP